MCGGTANCLTLIYPGEGLSPRVRGNRLQYRQWPRRARSIPACAGEPQNAAFRDVHNGVYPRVCGGTAFPTRRPFPRRGLSPRVRGNPGAAGRLCRPERSIPACAGEPSEAAQERLEHRVYPRVCGGTYGLRRAARCRWGLSPRVRGNRDLLHRVLHADGSIPACAGEPPPAAGGQPGVVVYPRVCGGTRRQALDACRRLGLSPRVRGNHARCAGLRRLARSIPACAGEPRPRSPPPLRS